MFIDVIKIFLETLLNAQVAEMLAAPIALLFACLLMFLTFSFFMSNTSKRIFLITICIVFVVYTVYMIASTYGFLVLPAVLGG